MHSDTHGITVVGTATVSVPADRVRLRIAVEHYADAAAEALTRSSESARSLRSVLRSAGVADQRLQTVGVAVDGQWGEQQKIVGYVARQRFSAIAENVAEAGELLEQLGRAVGDALRIESVEVFAADDAEARRLARNEAYDDAVAQASALAERAGRRLGHVRSIRPTGPTGMSEIYGGRISSMAKADSFAPGEVDVAERLEVSWDWADSTA